mmetsp:Transcript_9740/g.24273  ORF Transcript_9740/g.24273 Transcript_9740/m.24273 type:complete len:229 (-) Transcript_9740:170-856(-)
MTVCSTGGKKNYRYSLPSTPCDSERYGLSKTKMPLHTTLCSLPDHRKQSVGLDQQGRASCSEFPLLSDVVDEIERRSSLLPPPPSLRLKPRTRFQPIRTTMKPSTKASLSWLPKRNPFEAPLVTPSVKSISPMELTLQPLRLRSEAPSNSQIVGESLLGMNPEETIRKRVTTTTMECTPEKQQLQDVFCKSPPKVLLKPRPSTPLSPSMMNKENLIGGAEIPFLPPLP